MSSALVSVACASSPEPIDPPVADFASTIDLFLDAVAILVTHESKVTAWEAYVDCSIPELFSSKAEFVRQERTIKAAMIRGMTDVFDLPNGQCSVAAIDVVTMNSIETRRFQNVGAQQRKMEKKHMLVSYKLNRKLAELAVIIHKRAYIRFTRMVSKYFPAPDSLAIVSSPVLSEPIDETASTLEALILCPSIGASTSDVEPQSAVLKKRKRVRAPYLDPSDSRPEPVKRISKRRASKEEIDDVSSHGGSPLTASHDTPARDQLQQILVDLTGDDDDRGDIAVGLVNALQPLTDFNSEDLKAWFAHNQLFVKPK